MMLDPNKLGEARVAEVIRFMQEMNAATYAMTGRDRDGKASFAVIFVQGQPSTDGVLAAIDEATEEDAAREKELENAVLDAAECVEDEANEDTIAALCRAVAELRGFLHQKKERKGADE